MDFLFVLHNFIKKLHNYLHDKKVCLYLTPNRNYNEKFKKLFNDKILIRGVVCVS